MIVPFHHDALLGRWGEEKTHEYLAAVNEELQKLAPASVLIDPQAWRWYDIGIEVSME